MYGKKLAFGLYFVLVCVTSHATQGQWTEEYGQGNLGYFIDQDGIRLYIGCPTKEGGADLHSSISLSRLRDSAEIPKFTIDINSASYEGPFSADSRVGDNNFLSLLENLRKSDAVVKFGGSSVRFAKSNAAKVLPVFGKKFSCNMSDAVASAVPMQAPITPPASTNTANSNKVQKIEIARNAERIKQLKLPSIFLSSTIYVNYLGQWVNYMPMSKWLDLLLENKKIESLQGVVAAGNSGVLIKRPGRPAFGFLFRTEGKESYLSAIVANNNASLIQTPGEHSQMAVLLDSLTKAETTE